MRLETASKSESVSNTGGNAFTLVELLVVVAIIAILAALLLPALSRGKAQAYSTTCKNHLRQLGLALQSYEHDYDGYPYLRSHAERGRNDPVTENNRWWWAKLLPYYGVKWTDPAYHCPGYKGAIAESINYVVPMGSYAYNAWGARPSYDHYEGIDIPNVGLGLGPRQYRFSDAAPTRAESHIRAPSEMFAIGESRLSNAWLRHGWTKGGQCVMRCGLLTQNEPFEQARHGKNYNQLFCDGHVDAMSPWILFNPTNTAPMWNYDHEPHPELWPR